jgi:nitronate monooxygenase
MATTISNRLTRKLNIEHPIISAPMAFAAGGALASAVTAAGGLGVIGGGYGDSAWLDEQFEIAAGSRVGVGFITWSLQRSPFLLTQVLKRRPAAVMLSFGEPRPFVDEIRKAGALLICQCQNTAHIRDAINVGADVVVAQGTEAGGHGALRGTLSLVPEAADLLGVYSPDTLLVAAGGIADGRGLAAALMLGADGVLVGTRFWASTEALVHVQHHQTIIAANGDDTIRTTTVDLARQLPWPSQFTARVRSNSFTQRWHGREEALAQNVAIEGPRYMRAVGEGDPENAAVWFGEAAGLITGIEPASVIVRQMAADAASLLAGKANVTIA